MNTVTWKNKAIKQLRKIDTRYQASIAEKVAGLAEFPNVTLDITSLKGVDNTYRLRVGQYRVIFEVIDEEPIIISIEAVLKRDDRTYS